jgi:SNF2 family DNA or RNA helicase
MSCINLKSITLQEHQKKVLKFIIKPENRSVLLFHSLGSGKTLSSLVMAKCLMEKYPGKHVVIVAPASLTSNFEREAKRIKINFTPTIESYGIFLNKLKKKKTSICKNSILILDEVQNLNGESSIKYKYIYECAKKAFKVILLSATPVKNSPEELANQMSLLLNEKVSRSNIETIFDMKKTERDNTIKKLLRCKISVYKKSTDNADYPTIKDHVVKFTMPIPFYKEYYKVQENIKDNLPEMFNYTKDLAVFLNGIRRNVNISHTVSPKIIWTIDKINDDYSKNKKTMIYSNWLDAGINIIKEYLINANMPFSEVTGKLTKNEKDINVKKYNSDKTTIILISSSGGEGISLKKTRTVIILEPHWNSAKIEQVIGRAARYKSHITLPVKERKVDVYNLILNKPEKAILEGDLLSSADLILYNMSKSKEKRINTFYDIIEKNSIENDRKCK